MPALPHVVRLDLAVSVGALVEIGRESVLLSVKREHARIVPAELIGDVVRVRVLAHDYALGGEVLSRMTGTAAFRRRKIFAACVFQRLKRSELRVCLVVAERGDLRALVPRALSLGVKLVEVCECHCCFFHFRFILSHFPCPRHSPPGFFLSLLYHTFRRLSTLFIKFFLNIFQTVLDKSAARVYNKVKEQSRRRS